MAVADGKGGEGEDELWRKPQHRVCKHMNEDHEMSLLAYVAYYSGEPTATAARMVSFDAEGMEIVATVDGSEKKIYVAFKSPLKSPGQIRKVAVEMHKEAFARLGWRYRLNHGYYQLAGKMIIAGVLKKAKGHKVTIAAILVALLAVTTVCRAMLTMST